MRLRQEDVVQELGRVFVVNERLVVGRRRHELEAGRREDVGVEAARHGKPRAEERDAGPPAGLHGVARRGHDAQQRQRGAPLDVVEHGVRGVRGDDRQRRVSACQAADLGDEHVGQRRAIPRADEREHLVHVDAVDQDRGRGAVATTLPVGGEQRPVVFDGRLRADAANQAQRRARCHAASPFVSTVSLR